MADSSRTLRRVLFAVVAILVLVVVFTAGARVGARDPNALPGVLRDQVVGEGGPSSVLEGFEFIEDRYYRRPGGRDLADTALKGMVDGLNDPFSQYLDKDALAKFQQQQRNELEGIGVLIAAERRGLKISRVYGGSPAKAKGLKAGDLIVGAAGRRLRGLDADRATSLIRGKAGTTVRLVVERRTGGRTRTLRPEVPRAAVNVPIVTSRLLRRGDDKVGVVRLEQFTDGAGQQVGQAIRREQKRGAKAFVLDLRGNGGGQVIEAQRLVSLFVKGGTVVTLRGRAIRTEVYRAGDDPAFPRIPLVVLADRGSASASEIVAGALQDRDRAKLVGGRTFGKGVFQSVVQLASGGALDITAGRYFTPKNRNLGGKGTARGAGLKPDVAFDADERRGSTDVGAQKAADAALGRTVR